LWIRLTIAEVETHCHPCRRALMSVVNKASRAPLEIAWTPDPSCSEVNGSCGSGCDAHTCLPPRTNLEEGASPASKSPHDHRSIHKEPRGNTTGTCESRPGWQPNRCGKAKGATLTLWQRLLVPCGCRDRRESQGTGSGGQSCTDSSHERAPRASCRTLFASHFMSGG
jgi:hypothetical protein